MKNIRNQASKCETSVNMKKEVTNFHETLNKFAKGKENLDTILSNQRPFFNKIGLSLKSSRSHN